METILSHQVTHSKQPFNNLLWNKKFLAILFIFAGAVVGALTPFLGIYLFGLIAAVIGGIFLLRIKLNGKTAALLTAIGLYSNFLRPLGAFKYLSLMIDIMIFLIIIKYIFAKGFKKENTFVLFIVTGFVLLSFLQMFNPNIPSIMAGVEGLRKTSFPYLWFFVGLLAFTSAKEIKKFFTVLVLVSLPVLLYGIKQYFFLSSFDMLYLSSNSADMYTGMLFGRPRATSIFAGAFHFGMFAATLAVVSLFLLDTAKRISHKAFFFLTLIISMIACYSSLTRTNLIALILALVFYKILMNMQKPASLIFFPFLSVGIIFSMNAIVTYSQKFIYSSNEVLRLLGTIANFSNDSRLLGRTHGWETVFELIKKQPLLAYGTGSAGDTLQNTYNFQYHVTSHNFFLKVLMETGFVGLILVVLLVITLIFTMLKRIIRESEVLTKSIIACCLSIFSIFLINSFVNSTIETYPISGFILLAAAMPLIKFKAVEKKAGLGVH